MTDTATTDPTVTQGASIKSTNRLAEWGAVLVSIIVLSGFILVVVMLFTSTIPVESREIALIMFGGLNSMAAGVVGYWVGSSADAAHKTATFTRTGPRP